MVQVRLVQRARRARPELLAGPVQAVRQVLRALLVRPAPLEDLDRDQILERFLGLFAPLRLEELEE